MNQKLTLSFNDDVIRKAKKYASDHNISLSALIEFLLTKVTSSNYLSLEDYPVREWVNQVAEGEAVYKVKRSRKQSKDEFFGSKK